MYVCMYVCMYVKVCHGRQRYASLRAEVLLQNERPGTLHEKVLFTFSYF